MTELDDPLLDERGMSRLIWRCRRGMLENDLFLERFLLKHAKTMTVRQADSLAALMAIGDNDLLDLLLGRRQLMDVDLSLDCEGVREVLDLVRKNR
ncbi:MAG: succinate dehydrogenase assembly factor 2 [Rhodoferax sp.]|nr:succinate dehydrogenase assembly factor 2 [Rhodoferax sp.]